MDAPRDRDPADDGRRRRRFDWRDAATLAAWATLIVYVAPRHPLFAAATLAAVVAVRVWPFLRLRRPSLRDRDDLR